MPSSSYKVNGLSAPLHSTKSQPQSGSSSRGRTEPQKNSINHRPHNRQADPSGTSNSNYFSNAGTSKQNNLPYMTESEQRAISNGSIAKQVTKIFQEVLKEPRKNWGLQIEFFTSCLGFGIGLSNFWKLPYLITINGGLAFIFAYTLLLCLFGLPLYYLEAGISQFCQLGCLHTWRCAPLIQGVGVGMIILCLLSSIYNGQLVAYVTHYFFSSFIKTKETVVWGTCEETWKSCYDSSSNDLCSFQNYTFPDSQSCLLRLNSSASFYWEKNVLRLTDLENISEAGGLHWDIALSMLFVWFCVFLFLIKGTTSSGKVALVTGVAPLCILIALLVASVLQSGAEVGLRQLYDPDWEKLLDITVWQAALQQLMYSLGICYGCIFMLSSYNRFNNKIQYSVFVLCILQLFISVIASTTLFALAGNLAEKLFLSDARSVITYNIAPVEILFTLYPEAILRTLPSPHVWSVFFFLMLMLYGLHTQFVLVETCLTTVYDTMPKLRRRQFLVVLGLVIPLFLLSLPLSGSAGFHLHRLLESTITGPNVVLICLLELFSLNYLYGVRRICKDFKLMLGSQPSMFWKVMWILITPGIVLAIFVSAAVNWEDILYKERDTSVEWALYLTWALALLPLAVIPITFIYTIIYKLCTKESVFQPSPEWGPGVYEDQFSILNESRDRSVEESPKL